jgi:hypothetical protein
MHIRFSENQFHHQRSALLIENSCRIDFERLRCDLFFAQLKYFTSTKIFGNEKNRFFIAPKETSIALIAGSSATGKQDR